MSYPELNGYESSRSAHLFLSPRGFSTKLDSGFHMCVHMGCIQRQGKLLRWIVLLVLVLVFCYLFLVLVLIVVEVEVVVVVMVVVGGWLVVVVVVAILPVFSHKIPGHLHPKAA